jgi:hypothetical protein
LQEDGLLSSLIIQVRNRSVRFGHCTCGEVDFRVVFEKCLYISINKVERLSVMTPARAKRTLTVSFPTPVLPPVTIQYFALSIQRHSKSYEPTGDDGDLAGEIRYVIRPPGGVGREGLLCNGEDTTHGEIREVGSKGKKRD